MTLSMPVCYGEWLQRCSSLNGVGKTGYQAVNWVWALLPVWSLTFCVDYSGREETPRNGTILMVPSIFLWVLFADVIAFLGKEHPTVLYKS